MGIFGKAGELGLRPGVCPAAEPGCVLGERLPGEADERGDGLQVDAVGEPVRLALLAPQRSAEQTVLLLDSLDLGPGVAEGRDQSECGVVAS